MTAAMKLGAAFLLVWSCGCAPLPVVSVRMRARFEQDPRRVGRTLEARVDCGWSLERGRPPSAAAGEPITAQAELERAQEPAPCTVAPACAWEARERAAAFAALVPPAISFSEGEAP